MEPKLSKKSFAATVGQCRNFLTEAVALNIKQYAAALGQSSPTSQFERDVAEAILFAVSFHLAPKPEPFKKIRKQMLTVAKKAASAAETLQDLQLAHLMHADA